MTQPLPELSSDSLWFPAVNTALAEPDGLLAFGGDLSVARLKQAYQSGIFPWFSPGDPLLWWSPGTRAVFRPDSLHAGRSLRKDWQKHQYHFSGDQAFPAVVAACAAPRANHRGTWISAEIQQAYIALHHAGIAHSLEVWQQDRLVGGLYGVQVGALFCGESMFNRVPNAAKLALVQLQQYLHSFGLGWIDCQLPNPFLLQCGASPLPRAAFLPLLQQLAAQSIPTGLWQPGVIPAFIGMR
ncbi:MAG: leucyl/phenylalanyl-tRNA--protein transferase [Rheinheimera sp.]|nr:leucyl/phenylalanyl-tRNA--protein transferase [Rheinheimera sp.]